MNILKLAAIALVILVIANMILFALRKISALTFWFVIGAMALITFYILPNMKKQRILDK
jgi:hypothetical protein